MKTEMKYGIPNIAKVSRQVFYVGIVLGVVGGIIVLVLSACRIDLREVLPPCSLYTMTGLYCPGCGGTRACYALAQGNLWGSITMHPMVCYFAVGYLVYMISHILQLCTHGKIRGLYFCPYYWYIGIAILLIQFAAKNILLFTGYDVLAG